MMEPTETNAEGLEPGSELTPEPAPSRRRRPARVAVASVGAIVLVAAAIGVVSATGNDGTRPRLVLDPHGSSPAKESPAAANDSGAAPISSPYRYRLTVTAPDLGSDAPVARLETPAADDGRVATMAAALGLHGDVTSTAGGGRQVVDGSARLSVEPVPGGWAVSFGVDAGNEVPGAVPGSDGSGAASGSGGLDAPNSGSGTTEPDDPGNPGPPVDSGPVDSVPPDQPSGGTTPDSKVDPGVPAPPATVPPAVNLPEPAEAERIARSVLDRMGITGNWSATAVDIATVSDGVACAPEPCATPLPVATTRTVELRPRLDGVAIDGLSWQVTMGDNGDVVGVYGTWTTLRTLDQYPLRTVASVFADLEAGKGMSPFPDSLNAVDLGVATPELAAPITVTIDHVALGFTVFPASDEGVAVVDVVPTYVFSGTMSGSGGSYAQALVAVAAAVVPPADTTPPQTKPIDVSPPSAQPEPQPQPLPEPDPITEQTVAGKPPT